MPDDLTAFDRGTLTALLFALVAERLSVYFEYARWPTSSQSASNAAAWLSRNQRTLSLNIRRHLADSSVTLAKQIQESVSREMGLFISHEMNEALDPNYRSEIAQMIMKECQDFILAEFHEASGSGN